MYDQYKLDKLSGRIDVLEKALQKMTAQIKIKKLRPDAQLPKIMQFGDAAADIYAAEDAIVPPMRSMHGGNVKAGRVLVPTGFAMEMPLGYRAKLWSRSGHSLKNGIQVGAGLIDSKYRQEVGVLLYNYDSEPFIIKKGDRIAQMLIESYEHVEYIESEELEETTRTAGWGSSGR